MDNGFKSIPNRDIPDFDALHFQALMEAIASNDSVHDGAGYPASLTAIVIARIAQMAVEQAAERGDFSRTQPSDYRKRARVLVELALSGSGYLGGCWNAARTFVKLGELSKETFVQWCKNTDALEWQHIQNTARQCAAILQDLNKLRGRKGSGRGRKDGDLSLDAFEALQLSSMVQEAIVATRMAALAEGLDPDKTTADQVPKHFRAVIKGRLTSGELRNIGANDKDAIDSYAKKLKRFHQNLLDKTKPSKVTIDWSFRQLKAAE